MIIIIEIVAVVAAMLLGAKWWIVGLSVIGFEAGLETLRAIVRSNQKLAKYRVALQRSSRP